MPTFKSLPRAFFISTAVGSCMFALTGCATRTDTSNLQTSLMTSPMKTFHPASTNMSIMMPGAPTQDEHSAAGSRKFSCQDDSICFSIAEQGLEAYDTHDAKHLQTSIDQCATQMLSAMRGTETKGVPIFLSGKKYPGREIEGTFPGPAGSAARFRIRFYFDTVRAKMYCVGAVGLPEAVNSDVTTTFLKSLEVN